MTPATPDDNLIARVLAGPLTPELSAELDAWLRQDPSHPQRLAEFLVLEDMLVAARKEASATDVLSLLMEMEQAAEPVAFDTLHLPEPIKPTRPHEPSDLSARDIVSALSYLGLKALRSPAGLMSAAAVLLLGLVLAIVLLKGPNDSDRVVEAPDESAPIKQRPEAQSVVATLTDTHDATWAEGALAPGSQLRAGQRLTLTQGFAEITTNRGAEVLIEAPCTVEFTDNANAMRLFSGKLVGVCESPSSKGFVVRTPHVDVTDLGTRFGVAIDEANNTLAEVFEGEVRVDAADDSVTSRNLKRAESIALNAVGQEIPRSAIEEQPFASLAAVLAGIVDQFDSVTVVSTRPDVLTKDRFFSDSQVFVFPELKGEALPVETGVSITEPGKYDNFMPENLPPKTLPAGLQVRSYVVRMKPQSADLAIEGRLTFDAPILGVMTSSGDWKAFEAALPQQAIRIEQMTSELVEGLDSKTSGIIAASGADRLSLSSDRKTLEFKFYAQLGGADYIRVFIAVPESND